jgi:secreted trypsin-like serine protease
LGLAGLLAAGLALTLFAPPAEARGKELAQGSRVVGGGTTTIEARPFQVALVLDSRFYGGGETDFSNQFCGGTLITPRIVQTAAHCVVGTDPDDLGLSNMETNDLDVVAAKTQLSSPGGQRFDVVGLAVDGRYEPAPVPAFDAAWLVLSGPAAAPAAPVKIAGPGEAALWAPGAGTEVSGWGDTSQGGSGSDTLKSATVPVIPDDSCAALGGLYVSFSQVSMVCAGFLAGGTDSCQGDSGGPLVAPGFAGAAPVRRLVGVVSWGDGCAGPNAPGVYTRIAGPEYNPAVQQRVDELEAAFALPDAGSVYGAGAKPKPAAKKKCKKGKKRNKKGKCVRKKRKAKKPQKKEGGAVFAD